MRPLRGVTQLVACIALAGMQTGTIPERFAEGEISTGDMELNAAFTPDGRTIYFTRRTPKAQLWTIMASRRQGQHWSKPAVAAFSGQYADFDPFVSPDGSKLYFSSNRPVNGRPHRDFDIWVVERRGSGWTEPKRLDAPVNTDADEYYPTVSAAGTLYFSSTRAGGQGQGDIYRAPRDGDGFGAPENLGPAINSEQFDGDPFIAADESYLVFVSYGRPDGGGNGDIYVSRNSTEGWSPAKNLGPAVNSSALDFCPIVSPDGRFLYFTSERGFADTVLQRRLSYDEWTRRVRGPGNGLGDVFRVDARILGTVR